MSNPLAELKDLLNKKSVSRVGIVIRDGVNTIHVATATGSKEIPKSAGLSYKAGDSVRVFNGVAVGVVKSYSDLPVYYV